MQETEAIQVLSLGQGDPLEKEMATHPSILAGKISWTEEPGGLQSVESQRIGHNWEAEHAHHETENEIVKWIRLCLIFVYQGYWHAEVVITREIPGIVNIVNII